MRKGQGAKEYLMTYGWALLVIIIVGAALFALGVLNPATYQQKRCNGFQYFTYIDQHDTADQNVIHVRNSNNDISITAIKVGSGTEDTSPTVSDSDIQEGDEFTITTNNVPSGVTAGTNYDNLAVRINYSVTNGISNVVDTATCDVTAR